jgi:hypothetical protein
VGRFFFVQRAQAIRDGSRLETYEFLHATFGEFLAARLTVQLAADLLARRPVLTVGQAPAEDDLLYALLSYAPLSSRQMLRHVRGICARQLAGPQQQQLAELLVGGGEPGPLPGPGEQQAAQVGPEPAGADEQAAAGRAVLHLQPPAGPGIGQLHRCQHLVRHGRNRVRRQDQRSRRREELPLPEQPDRDEREAGGGQQPPLARCRRRREERPVPRAAAARLAVTAVGAAPGAAGVPGAARLPAVPGAAGVAAAGAARRGPAEASSLSRPSRCVPSKSA